MVILDIADLDGIDVVARLNWDIGGNTHTCLPLPGRNLVVVTDEAVVDDCEGAPHMVRGGGRLRRVSTVRRLDLPHGLKETSVIEGSVLVRTVSMRTGQTAIRASSSCSQRGSTPACVSTTWPIRQGPKRSPIGSRIALRDRRPVQINDVYVADDLTIYATDRVTGGVYALEPEPWLAAKLDNGRRSP